MWPKQGIRSRTMSLEGGRVLELSRRIVEDSFPEEIDAFDSVVLELMAKPRNVYGSRPLKAPVGIGIELAMMAPYVLSVLELLASTVTQEAVSAARELLQQATRDAIKRVLVPESPDDVAKWVPLTPQQEQEVYDLVRRYGVDFKLSRRKAERLAVAVIGGLRLRKGPGDDESD